MTKQKSKAKTKKSAKSKVGYVDGYVLVVPKAKVAAYQKMAKEGCQVWMECGALYYYECQGDDLKPSNMGGGEMLGFPALTQAKKDETVWFSYVGYRSRAHRDAVNKKVHKAMEKMAEKYKDFIMPFDLERMAYGGFKVMVGE